MVDVCLWKFLKVLFPFSFNILLGKKHFCIVTLMHKEYSEGIFFMMEILEHKLIHFTNN